MFWRLLALLVLGGLIFFGINMMVQLDSQTEMALAATQAVLDNDLAVQLAKIDGEVAVEQDFENRALDTVADVANNGNETVAEVSIAGYTAIVEVAKSGDAAQTMTAGFMVALVWGIGLIIVGVTALIFVSKGNKKETNQPAFTKDFGREVTSANSPQDYTESYGTITD